MRLQATIGKTVLEPALNEVFFGNEKPYRTTKYEISIGRLKERHKSSGVLVSISVPMGIQRASMSPRSTHGRRFS